MSSLTLKSLIKKLNPSSHQALERAASICVSRQQYNIELDHWFLAFLEKENLCFCQLLKDGGINLTQLITDIQESLEHLKTGNDQAPAISPRIVEVINEAWLIASVEHAAADIHTGFVLLALLQNTITRQVAYGISAEFKKLSLDVVHSLLGKALNCSIESEATPIQAIKQSNKALEQYATDLVQQAKDGKIDAAIGREDEINQIIDVLSRRRQNNAILTGEPGVGKTAIVEGLALRIAEHDVPELLEKVSIQSLDLGALQAGASVKGEFENRLKQVITEVKTSPTPIILFIDEAHTMIGAGNQTGGGDAANLLKPALARGELRCIAATTWSEYKQYFEKDAALTRRFQVVKVAEPNSEVATQMLRSVVDAMEQHHSVKILEEALNTATLLSERYITERQLPDKSISVLDTACSRIASKQKTTPPQINQLQKQMTVYESEFLALKKEATQGYSHTERIKELKRTLKEQKKQLDALKKQWQHEKKLVDKINALVRTQSDGKRLQKLKDELNSIQDETPLVLPFVDSQAVAEVISDWTGIPVSKMKKDQVEQVFKIENRLNNRVIGQEHAMQQIAQRLKAHAAKITDPNKPVGVFLFLGTSGVGKTETALALADYVYGSEKKISVINMSEFKEEHKVSTLVGAPPGYVGYGEGGVLTEAVRRTPYNLILLDEVEKAHPGVHDVFYQVFDKGNIKDGQGRDIDFKNSMLILTSNAGDYVIQQYWEQLQGKDLDPDELVELLMPALAKHFKPAFLGRLTIIPFFPLSDSVMEKIVTAKLNKVIERVQIEHKIFIKVTKAVNKHILAFCNQAALGARQVDNVISKSIMPTLSEKILAGIVSERTITSIAIGVNKLGKFSYKLTYKNTGKKP